MISFRYLTEQMATGIFSGVSPAAHSLAAVRAIDPVNQEPEPVSDLSREGLLTEVHDRSSTARNARTQPQYER